MNSASAKWAPFAGALVLFGCGLNPSGVPARDGRLASNSTLPAPGSPSDGSTKPSGVPLEPSPNPKVQASRSASSAAAEEPRAEVKVEPGDLIHVRWQGGLLDVGGLPKNGRLSFSRTSLGRQTPLAGLVMLDEERPRSSTGRSISLKELLPEDEEPAPGEHRLVGCVSRMEELACEAISIRLDARGRVIGTSSDVSGKCVLVDPGGTFWGGGKVPLLVLRANSTSEEPSDRPSVEVLGPLRASIPPLVGTFALDTDRHFHLSLGAGDFQIRVHCGGEVLSRTITVNPEGRAP
jgi:hypothetical protein